MRDTSKRRSQISTMVRERGSVQVASLANLFHVSMQTIRKDLHYLTGLGVTTRAYGGAISSSVVNTGSEPPLEAKLGTRMAEKERIGRFAAFDYGVCHEQKRREMGVPSSQLFAGSLRCRLHLSGFQL